MNNTNLSRLERLWLWFFPRRCVWCGGVTEPGTMLCTACEPEAAPQRLADALLPGTRIPLVSVFSYHSKAKGIFLRLKFSGMRKAAPHIGYAMGDALKRSLDKPAQWVLCPVPMTTKQIEARGYNQSALLAKRRETRTQHSLPAAQREENVSGAYAAAGKIKGRRIVLCDDICTTGATLRACCGALREAGAKEIVCLTFLRTEIRH